MQTADDIEISPPPAAQPGRFSDLVHKLGTAAAAKVSRKIETREELLRKSEQQHEQALAKLRAEREAALSVQDRLNSLQVEIEKIQDEIIHAKSTFSAFQAQLASLEKMRLDAWGNPAVTGIGVPSYIDIVNLRIALTDWPRVEAHLAKKLERAQKALSEFERAHS